MSTSFKFTLRFIVAMTFGLWGAAAAYAAGPTTIVQVVDQALLEGDSGNPSVPFQVVLDAGVLPGSTVTVHYHTTDGTANGGSDYVSVPAGVAMFTNNGVTPSS